MRQFNAIKNVVNFGKGNQMRLTPVKEMRLIEPRRDTKWLENHVL